MKAGLAKEEIGKILEILSGKTISLTVLLLEASLSSILK